jgi:toxin ParE1/3/4
MRLILRPSAKRDLALIWSSTESRWDRAQADSYVIAINRRLGAILDFPSSYPEYRSRHGKFRKAPSGEHVIFYLVSAEQVDVIRILHNRMDADAQLG